MEHLVYEPSVDVVPGLVQLHIFQDFCQRPLRVYRSHVPDDFDSGSLAFFDSVLEQINRLGPGSAVWVNYHQGVFVWTL